MDTNKIERAPQAVPYVVFCDTVANYQWVIKKLVIALVIVVFMMFASNLAWLFVWQSYDYSSTETTLESDGNGIANFTGGDGGVIYGGTSDSQENNQDTAQ